MCTDSLRDSLVGFLYGELTTEDRRAFDAHLRTCGPCRVEVAELRAVRDDLLGWAPPECRELPSSWTAGVAVAPAPMDRLRAWAPAFGLAAAAMLVLAVSAAIANLEVRYDAEGLVVRTGRAAAPAPVQETTALAPAAAARQAQSVTAQDLAAVTAADLAALEARLLQTFADDAPRAGLQPVGLTSDNPQLSREVRRLIEESERRTRQEMAARFLDIVSDFEGHRRADMLRVQQVLGQVQSRTGAEMAQTRDAVNRLLLVSQNQGQEPR
ncbi:MAG TPA: zf-HC2 domain-containing protein [Vicinamibacterales bacterium]|nr:zf-HC2 domain-containing protein [Vicinamibacterales bacterium]